LGKDIKTGKGHARNGDGKNETEGFYSYRSHEALMSKGKDKAHWISNPSN